MTGRFSLIPAAYVYLLRDGAAGREVLLQLRGETGYMNDHWAAAAGHVERGETAHDAARREVREEIGVEVGDLHLRTIMQRTARAEAIDERIDFFFTTTDWRGEPRVMEPRKCQRLGWFPLDALPERVVPHERWVLEHLEELAAYTTDGFETDEQRGEAS